MYELTGDNEVFQIDPRCAALLGHSIGVDEMMARWAYSEIRSSRFATNFVASCSDITKKVLAGYRFDALSNDDRRRLVAALAAYRSRLLRGLRKSGTVTFVLENWDKTQLSDIRVLPALGAVSLAQFASAPIAGSGKERPDVKDPRLVAAQYGPNEPFVQREGIFVMSYIGSSWLLDGTLRSLLFLSRAMPADRIPAWVGQPKRSNATDA